MLGNVLGECSEWYISDDLFAEVLYPIPRCFQVSNISALAAITEALHRKECRKYMSDWREKEVKKNVLFHTAACSGPDLYFH